MSAEVRLEGGPELQRALRSFSSALADEIEKEIDAAGLMVRSDIQHQMHRSTPTGELYKRTNPTRTHRASAAGQPPAVDTGRLVNSITFKKTGTASAEVFTDVEYGPWLEFGTMHIDPRPAWIPAVERIQPRFVERVVEAIARAAQ